ncbi:MAG TPA: hypothetical protein VHT03_14850 [Rhizomicrobium sp.]|jgi:hypothetical protein|nr:hypothetical protein [Rhizomicrobium sp.]
MNKLLEEAIAEASRLPDDRQEAVASRILEEIGIEHSWDERFAKSQDLLSGLSRKAGEHIGDGATLPPDPISSRTEVKE